MISVCAMRAETFTISSTQHLADLISEEQKTTLTELIVTTEDNTLMNKADWDVIEEMKEHIEVLNLSGVGFINNPGEGIRINNLTLVINSDKIREFWCPNNVSMVNLGTQTNLEDVYLPANVQYGTNGLRFFGTAKSVSLYGEGESNLDIRDGVVYYKENDYLVLGLCPSKYVPADNQLVIAEGVTKVYDNAFAVNNPNIREILLPSSFQIPAKIAAITKANTGLEKILVDENNPYMTTLFDDYCLYDKESKSIIWTSKFVKFDENLVIDGSVIESIPQSFLDGHSEVKHLKFTEGYKTLGYAALKNANGVEVLELPASLESIGGEAMVSMSKLKYVLHHASMDPLGEDNEFFQVGLYERPDNTYIGWVTFRGKPDKVTIAVPQGAKNLYINSAWNRNWTHPDYSNNADGFNEDQFVEHTPLKITNGTTFHDAAAAGMVVTIKAKNPYIKEEGELNALADEVIDPSRMKFVGWIDLDAGKEGVEPVEFADPESEETTFVMPDRPVNIIAGYSNEDGTVTAIESVEAATDAAPVFYNLQGRIVENPSEGLYIVRRGSKVAKELVR